MGARIQVFLEVGKKLTHASALDWPGWSRSGSDEAGALEKLLDHGPRYAEALASQHLAFDAPKTIAELVVAGRLDGTASTDFGVPSLALREVARLLEATPEPEVAISLARKPLSLLALHGLGKEIWEGIDPREYVGALRDEWDRP